MNRPLSSTLLVGFDPRTCLAVARSLHRRGVRVVVATIAEWEEPIRSSAVAAYVKLPGAEDSAGNFLQALVSTIQLHQVNTVIPITDRALVFLSAHDAVLRKRVTLLCPTPEQLSTILDKGATTRLARRLGIPVPDTVDVCESDALQPMTEHLKFPLFVKSRDKARSCRCIDLPPQDARLCESLEQLEAIVATAEAPQNLLVQNRIPGDDVGLAVLISGGDALCSFQYRAQKRHPSEGGVCVLARSECVNTVLLACAVRLLRKLEWDGVAQIDFRHDPQTGKFALLEVNGRFWGSTAVAVVAGIDFPYLAWQLAHGQVPRCTGYRTGVLVRWLEGDIRRLFELRTNRHPASKSFSKELMAFVRDFRPSVRGMFWSWRDPIAGLAMTFALGRSWMASRLRIKSSPTSRLATGPNGLELCGRDHSSRRPKLPSDVPVG